MIFYTVVALLLACSAHSVGGVSFYGESYINIPLEDGSRRTELELRFKTPRPHGLLFLAKGRTDFLLLELVSGALELRLDLGSGEAKLESEAGRLDDLDWHYVKVIRTQTEIVMTVDMKFTTRGRAAGTFTELNIDDGIFLGGTGPTVGLEFKKLKKFRGCQTGIEFNKLDLEAIARQLNDPLKIVEVSWQCDDEFDGGVDAPISFASGTSYAAFPHLQIEHEGTVSFEVKTRTRTALLLFNTGKHSGYEDGFDFVALEILNEIVKLSVSKSGEVIHVTSDQAVNDGNWHMVDLSVSSSGALLRINGIFGSALFKNTTDMPDLKGHLFLGGVNLKAKALAIRLGLQSFQNILIQNGAILGCIRSININFRRAGFPQILSSRLIDPQCGWNWPCSSNPCKLAEEICVDLDDRYECRCESKSCMIAKMAEVIPPSSDSDGRQFQTIAVREVSIEEGTKKAVTRENIDVVFDYKKYRIRESSIMFKVKRQPQHGTIEIDLGRRTTNDAFTLLDLLGDKVYYIHDGSESLTDEITMEMEIYGSDRSRPEFLNEKYDFVLTVNITQINDAPRIELGSQGCANIDRGNQGCLRMAENTKIRISNDIINGVDPDSREEQLEFMVTYTSPSDGYFEKVGRTGDRLSSFTQLQINNRQIWYVSSSKSSYIRLKLSDGLDSSDTAILKIETIQIQLTVERNTGLTLPHGSTLVISSDNLTTATNVPSQDIEIRYKLTQPPSFGTIQRQQYADSEWIEVTTFAQRHVNDGRIRYSQQSSAAETDYDQFIFIAEAQNFETPRNIFRIQFERVYIFVETNSKLTFRDESFTKLTRDHLRAITNNRALPASEIHFNLSRTPSFGHFYKLYDADIVDFLSLSPLTAGSHFTQADINNNLVYYKLRGQSFDNIQDFVNFTVKVPGGQSKSIRFMIEYIPGHNPVRFVNNGLREVIEGGQKAIERSDLYIETDEYSMYEYTVITHPRFGVLELVDSDSGSFNVKERNISQFTNRDIRDLRLVYHHDNSENNKDSFMFLAVPVIAKNPQMQMEISEFTGTFHIQISMRNDNPPVRLVNKVFHVVANKDRLITINDLAFTDPDIDYDPNDLQYERRGIPNGEITLMGSMEPLYNFTQRDLVEKRILFRHSGSLHGRAAIKVTDGQFISWDLFEIEAGDPYVQVVNNTGGVVRNGREVQITLRNLSIETNVNVNDTDVRFVLIEEPVQGHLRVGGQEVIEFSLANLKEGLFYKHEGSPNIEDQFKFAVLVGDAQAQASFSIQIYMESMQFPPRIINNRVLEVSGRRPGIIDQSHLQVTHVDSPPEQIEYVVLILPKYGTLYVSGVPVTVLGDTTFTQDDVNKGKVSYGETNATGTSDQFIFEVSNGFQTLRGLEFLIEIIPTMLPFQVKNFTVREGGRKPLSINNLKIKGRYYEGKSLTFIIVAQPQHGFIENIRNRGTAISTFSSEELKQGIIYYSHDDSEELSDNFSLKVRLKEEHKESEVQTVTITVLGLNDRAPRVAVNRGLQVWKDSITALTSDVLSVDDPDSPLQNVMFRISSPTNGHVALLNNTFRPISNFSQALINSGQVVFVHSGANSGEFSFEVTDGHNRGELQRFRIKAKPLVLSLEVNRPLSAYPNTMQPISSENLFTLTNDPYQSRAIIYSIESKPRHGDVVTLVKQRPLEVTSFTQGEVNGGEIYYRHKTEIPGWKQSDSFRFGVSTMYAEPLTRKEFTVSVSYGNLNEQNKDQLIRIRALNVDEGGEGIISSSNLDVSDFVQKLESLGKDVTVEYVIDSLPVHGSLRLRGHTVLIGTRFIQKYIDRNELRYVHDDSDTTMDNFTFSLKRQIHDGSVRDDVTGKESSFTAVFNITIQPVNDQRLTLETPHPSIRIIQGFTTTITSELLRATDPDTEAAYLVYSVVKQSENGFLVFREYPDSPIRQFTQQDINDDRLVFKQDGTTNPGAFYFQVSDGVHTPYNSDFNIHVIPIYVDISQNSTVELIQADSFVNFGTDSVNVTTNGHRRNVVYRVVTPPKYGAILVGESQVQQFKQSDLDSKSVVYKQTDFSSGRDTFGCDITYEGIDNIRIRNRVISIRVTALVMSYGPLEAPGVSPVAITSLILDASKLSQASGDNPVYTILDGPYFGKIVKQSRRRRDLYTRVAKRQTQEDVQVFSHEDIIYLKIFYIANSFIPRGITKDNFTYQLSAHNVQPAEAVFHINIAPSGAGVSPNPPVTKISQEPKSVTKHPLYRPSDRDGAPVSTIASSEPREDEVVRPSDYNNDYMIVLAIIIPLVVLVIIGVIIIFIIWKKRRRRNYSPPVKKSPRMRPHISGPYQIDQPHVHIEPQQQCSPSSDESKSLVVYQNTENIPKFGLGPEDERSEDVMTPMLTREIHHIPPRSPDISRTEVSYAVPNCKVTPMIENEEDTEDQEEMSQSNGSLDVLDWISSDPELLEHCRTTPPVLRKSQYWV